MTESTKVLELKLTTMTGSSLWTGGIDQSMTYVKATSILGGLRFWTEALLRSQGYKVCSQARCTYDSKNPESTCAACVLFGCTGLARPFILKTETHSPVTGIVNQPPACVLQGARQARYYFKTGYTGAFTLKLVPQRPFGGVLCIPAEVQAALVLMVGYGTLGAQDQYGCGLSVPVDKSEFKKLAENAASCIASQKPSLNDSDSHGLKSFFFFKGKLKEGASPQITMGTCRHDIREVARALKGDTGGNFRHRFCGQLNRANSCGTCYNLAVSNRTLYGWGYFPPQSQYSRFQKDMLNGMNEVLKTNLEGVRWKEFQTEKRDQESFNKFKSDWNAYLADLLNNAPDWRS